MTIKLNSYADVQKLLNSFVAANSLTPGLAPHAVFWEALSYKQFISGEVPNLGVKILEVGNADNSNLIKVLKGTLAGFPRMPAPNPPYNANTPSENDVIAALSDWINRQCPN